MFPKVDFLGTPTDTYALCLLVSLIVLFICVLAFKPKEFPFRYVFWGVIIVFVFAILGANLLNIIINIFQHKGYTIGQIFPDSGLSYLGVPIFGFLALWIYLRCIRIPFLVVADYVVLFAMLERFIGRIGCLGYGCCYGIPSGLPWAYPFNVWGITQVVPRHPTQVYEMIYALAIFISTWYLYKRTADIRAIPKPEGWEKRTLEERKELIGQAPSAGIIFFYVFFWYGLLRFFNEFLRAEGPFIYGPFKLAHAILAVFVIVSAAGLLVIIKKSAEKDEILKSLKEASIRLFVWLAIGAVVFLSLITIHIHAA